MSEIECPKCGRLGNVPREKLNSRLVCKKCNSVFHITPTGRVVLGDLPDHKYEEHHAQAAAAAEKKRHAVATDEGVDYDFKRTGMLVGVLALGLLGIAALFYFPGGSSRGLLEPKAQLIAKALVDDDLKSVISNTAKEGEVETGQWYTQVQNVVADMKREAADKKLDILVMVLEDDPDRRVGQVEIAYLEAKGTSRSELIAREAGAKTSGRTTLTVPIYWVYEGGDWLIDGKKTFPAAANIH